MISIRFLRQTVVFSLMTVLISAMVHAQPPGGGRGGRGGFGGRGGTPDGGGGLGGGRGFTVDRAMLLGADPVRTELKIEEAQAATIDAALEAYREERSSSPRPDRDAFQKMSEEERAALMEKYQKEREVLSKKTDEVLNALLEPDQAKRLDQIGLQLQLSMATIATLKGDDLKAKLTITDEQIAKLDEVEKTAAADMQKVFAEMQAAGGGRGGAPDGGGGRGEAPGGPGAGFEAMREKMTAAREKMTESAMAVLTDVQTKKLDELKGPKTELDMRALMGGRGGFGGPGGGQGAPGGGRQRGQGGGRPGGTTRPAAE